MKPFCWSVSCLSYAIAVWFVILITGVVACNKHDPFHGTELRHRGPAASFELLNHLGQKVSLTDYEGKVVLLTFLYSSCTDVCPIITRQLRQTHDTLGGDADAVAIIVISVDPEQDTVETAHAYSERWHMTNDWDFLVGKAKDLVPIWKAYYLDPVVDEHVNVRNGVEDVPSQLTQASRVSGLLGPEVENGRPIIHSTPVYLIDRDSSMRVVFTSPLSVDSLVHDVRLLLK